MICCFNCSAIFMYALSHISPFILLLPSMSHRHIHPSSDLIKCYVFPSFHLPSLFTFVKLLSCCSLQDDSPDIFTPPFFSYVSFYCDYLNFSNEFRKSLHTARLFKYKSNSVCKMQYQMIRNMLDNVAYIMLQEKHIV